MDAKDRPYILWEIKKLQCSIINLSGENYGHGFMETQVSGQPRLVHFYLEVFLFLINKFKQKRGLLDLNKGRVFSRSARAFFEGVKKISVGDKQYLKPV